MRRDTKTGAPDFFVFARDYLHTYMPTIRGLSATTIEAYRISLECFLTFLTDHEHIDRSKVSFDHFDRARLKAWLAWLAEDKHYAKRTITLRLSAIKAFLAYAAAEDVTLVALSQAARSLKALSAPRKPIEYLTGPETRAVLAAFTGRTAKSRRNRMLLILLYDTAARVGEITDLTLADLSLTKPCHVRLTGKRSKSRNRAVDRQDRRASARLPDRIPPEPSVAARDTTAVLQPASRATDRAFGRYRLGSAQAGRPSRPGNLPDRARERPLPHVRKTKAMDLYQQGIPLPIIMRLLGHENASTTAAFYAFATVDMMRAAVNAATPAIDVPTEHHLTDDKLQALYSLR